MRINPSGRRDRVLAAIELPALGVWLGALAGFAFVSAPLAFRIVAPIDAGRFAALTAHTIGALTLWGYVLGGIAIVTGLMRAATAGDRTWDFARAGLVALALALAAYEDKAVVPQMQATTDVRSDAYHALHSRSTVVYGGVVLLVLAAMILGAARRDE
jgi:Domain of unknown function (DUF4149)